MFEQFQQHPVHGESGKQHMTIFKTRRTLRVVCFLSLALIVTMGFIALLSNHPGKVRAKSDAKPNSPVGAWFVNAVGAPFQPHLVTFHADGTMLIDNPEAGDPHTSDSVGMGPWQIQQNGKDNATVIGKFEEINADRTTHEFVSTLIVTFTITVNEDTFTGPAEATYYNPDGTTQAGPFPATLNGTRIQLSQSSSTAQNKN
jgi:hypothetical protein